MRSGQRETRVVVIENRGTPPGCVVAHVALLGKIACNVIRIVRLLIIRQVTAHTGSIRQVVTGSAVTLAALQPAVCPSQWPSGAGMIEGRGRPVCGRMADLALLREACGSVFGTVRGVVFRTVTSVAVRRYRRVVVVLMAVRAGHGRMFPR